MRYEINNNCIACGSCAVVCGHNAIDTGYSHSQIKDISGKQEFGDPFIINNNCTGCGACLAVCWPGAIEEVRVNQIT
ncbi:4Fe-4S dicluster domain-containing protein [Desulfitibacter alkalitolerans]|uniref:4Fe-4S dicluster domain-containing protein n=1 Tax=Desulfitibacter alkalitolerans TaxID=264641 RepID=UPI000486E642|nr:4Fe-4S dicluster domain-containing protein [Desulfitibacter alkalitolerans]